MPVPNLPDDLEPLELARGVFDAWRAATPEPRSELPAPLVQIAHTLLVCHDAEEIAAALGVSRGVLLDADEAPDASSAAPMPPTPFVALPATGTNDATVVVERSNELVVECSDGTVIRTRGAIDPSALGALVRELRIAPELRP